MHFAWKIGLRDHGSSRDGLSLVDEHLTGDRQDSPLADHSPRRDTQAWRI
jgi:hypothetical protein